MPMTVLSVSVILPGLERPPIPLITTDISILELDPVTYTSTLGICRNAYSTNRLHREKEAVLTVKEKGV